MKDKIKDILKKIYKLIMFLPISMYRTKMRKKLKNNNFSIISSDCFGSFVYHTVKEKFNSPTINLFFSQYDFLLFVSYLKDFLQSELVEISDPSVNYPVGQLTYNNHSIRLDFMHYASFDEAKQKWNDRKSRIDFTNIYIIQIVPHGLTQKYADLFSALPYKNKLLITHKNNINCDCMVTHDIFSRKNYKSGDILRYKSIFSPRRHMDDIDYISFLNRCQ